MNQPTLSWQTWRTPEKLHKWYGDRAERRESCKPRLNPRPEKWFFPDPRFTQKSPKMGEGQFFPPLPQKMPILFHSGNKRQFKLCPKSVSNYQNQLVEAEKLFKKSHIFAWFHCKTSGHMCWKTQWGRRVQSLDRHLKTHKFGKTAKKDREHERWVTTKNTNKQVQDRNKCGMSTALSTVVESWTSSTCFRAGILRQAQSTCSTTCSCLRRWWRGSPLTLSG